MTTVAWDGPNFASDMLVVGAFKHTKKHHKIFKVGQMFVAAAGACSDVAKFGHWLKTNWSNTKKKEGPLGEAFEAMVWDPATKVMYLFQSELIPLEIEAPYAIGSGSDFAMGAMRAGVSAMEAVLIASTLDSSTDSNVEYVKLSAPSKGLKSYKGVE